MNEEIKCGGTHYRTLSDIQFELLQIKSVLYCILFKTCKGGYLFAVTFVLMFSFHFTKKLEQLQNAVFKNIAHMNKMIRVE